MQSPVVDIRTGDVPEREEEIAPLQIDYQDLFMCSVVARTQGGWRVEPGKGHIHLSNGPLDSPYRLYEIHGHIVGGPGLESCRRHTVDGREYVGELHLLHFDPLLNPSPTKKLNPPPDHKVIICILLEEGKKNKELSKIKIGLDNLILHETQKTGLDDEVDPTFLFPGNLEYWMYKTEEEGLEGNKKETTWIIFKQPIQASEGQIAAMRSFGGQEVAEGGIPPQNVKIIDKGLAVLNKPSGSKCSQKCCPCF